MNAPPPEHAGARVMACHDLADDLELEFVQPGLQRQLELINKKAEEVDRNNILFETSSASPDFS